MSKYTCACGHVSYSDHNVAYHQEVVCRLFPNSKKSTEMLYSKPNDGHRILPSVYVGLKINWLRASGQYQKPESIPHHHAKAILSLLKESHINVVDKSTSILGKIAAHYANQPDISAKLAELCILMQRVDVDDMYPIFDVIVDQVDEEYVFEKPLENWLNAFEN